MEGQALSNIAPLLDRNRAFAADPGARQDMPALPFIPNLNLYIVTCIDCRVDPAQILGVRLGEALVQLPGPAAPAAQGERVAAHRLHPHPAVPRTVRCSRAVRLEASDSSTRNRVTGTS